MNRVYVYPCSLRHVCGVRRSSRHRRQYEDSDLAFGSSPSSKRCPICRRLAMKDNFGHPPRFKGRWRCTSGGLTDRRHDTDKKKVDRDDCFQVRGTVVYDCVKSLNLGWARVAAAVSVYGSFLFRSRST